jgi:hypothetical protein
MVNADSFQFKKACIQKNIDFCIKAYLTDKLKKKK